MRVKICGLTRAEDAALAQELGAWALGMIFYPKSKRFITADAAKSVIAALPKSAQPIGVFVNQTQEALSVAPAIGLKGIQLHGDETPDECRTARAGFNGLLIKAFRPENAADVAAMAAYKDIVDYILVDAPAAPGQYGGTGHTGDWGVAAEAAKLGIPLILAGGLGPDNISEALRAVKPYAADLASGVEQSPGVKDHIKLRALFGALEGAAA